MVNVDTDQSKPIPREINLWGGKKSKFYGLSIADFQYFGPDEERYLRGKYLFYYLRFSAQELGPVYDGNTVRRSHEAIQDRKGSPYTRNCQAGVSLRVRD